jgi:hypothetical protein
MVTCDGAARATSWYESWTGSRPGTVWAPIAEVSKLLRHSRRAMTVRYLGHVSNRAAARALQAIKLPSLSDA